MSGETVGPNPSNAEALQSVVEKSEKIPSSSEVIESFSHKIESLKEDIATIESQPGFNLDAIQMLQKKRELAASKAALGQVESLWEQLGGGDIDAANQLKNELGFKADADDYNVANTNIRDAKDSFYQNFLKEYANETSTDLAEPQPATLPEVSDQPQTGAENSVVDNTSENTGNSTPKPLEKEPKKPESVPTETGASDLSVKEKEGKFPTQDEVLARLRESDKWKNASEEDRQIYEAEVVNRWIVANAQHESATSSNPKGGSEESVGEATAEKDHFPTLDEVLAKLQESDRFKGAPAEEQELLIETTTNEYIAAAAKRVEGNLDKEIEEDDEEEKDKRTDAEKRIDLFLEENTQLTEGMSDTERESFRKTMIALMAAGLLNEAKLPAPKTEAESAETTAESQLSPEEKAIGERLVAARNEYARLTAEDRRSYLGRFLQGDGWLSNKLRSIPKVASMMDAINDRFGGKEMKAAIAAFESATKEAMKAAEARLIEEGKSPESQELKEAKIALQIDADRDLEDKIIEERHKQSKKAGRFTNWWAQHQGWRWNIVKGAGLLTAGLAVGASAGAIAAVAGVAGATIGIFGFTFGTGASIAGGLAGGATGLGIARGVSSRRANATAEKGGSETIAQQQSRVDRTNKATVISQAEGNTNDALDRLVRGTEQSTSNEMLRNRKRIRTAMSLGASAGALAGGFTGGRLHQYLNTSRSRSIGNGVSGGQYTNGNSGGPDLSNPNLGPNGGSATPEVNLDNTFNVEDGSGFIREWDQWAGANGHPISRETATQLHYAIKDEFGPNGIIDLDGVKKALETYTQNGDLRIGRAAGAHWRQGVAEFAQKWLEARGKW